MNFLSFFQWLENTPGSIYIRESTTVWPAIICVHALSLALSAGTIMTLDVRLVGWGLRKTPVSTIFENLRPWTLWGFIIMFITGGLLFWSEPVKCYKTASFTWKMIFIALAGINAFIFDKKVYPTVAAWDTAEILPARARFAGAAGLFLWTWVIVFGRWFAYF